MNPDTIKLELLKAIINFFILFGITGISYLVFQKWLAQKMEIERSGRGYIGELRLTDTLQSRVDLASIIGDFFEAKKNCGKSLDSFKLWLDEENGIEVDKQKILSELRWIKASMEEISRIVQSTTAWQGITRDYFIEWIIDYYQFWNILLILMGYKNVYNSNDCFINRIKEKSKFKKSWNDRLISETVPKIIRTLHMDSSESPKLEQAYIIK